MEIMIIHSWAGGINKKNLCFTVLYKIVQTIPYWVENWHPLQNGVQLYFVWSDYTVSVDVTIYSELNYFVGISIIH